MRRSVGAAFGGFFALGLFWGAWAAVLPTVQEATRTSKGALGIALLFVTLGSAPAMLLVAGPLIDRFGTRATALAAAAFAAATLLPGLATSLAALFVALLLTGAASGAFDVGINTRVAQIEDATGRRPMAAGRGPCSVGGLVGAGAVGPRRR